MDLAGSERQRDTHTVGLRLKVELPPLFLHFSPFSLSSSSTPISLPPSLPPTSPLPLSPPHTLTGGRKHQQVTLGPRQCDHGSSGHYSRKITTCALPRLKTHLPTQSMSCSVPSTDSWHSSELALFQAISPDLSLYGGGNNKACSLHHVVQSSATTGVSNLLCMLLSCVEGISTTGLTGWKR